MALIRVLAVLLVKLLDLSGCDHVLEEVQGVVVPDLLLEPGATASRDKLHPLGWSLRAEK